MRNTSLQERIASSDRARFGPGVSEEIIRDAELVLGVRFPPSYRWWLSRYGSGYLGGYKLQGLAPFKPSDRNPTEAFVGDIVWTTLRNRAEGLLHHLLELLNYEGDEIYFLDLSVVDADECPVVRREVGADALERVAASFADFLSREI